MLLKINNILDLVSSKLRTHSIIKETEADAIALWSLNTYLYDVSPTLPILFIKSATMRCGKTTLIGQVSYLCNKSNVSSNMSEASFFRLKHRDRATIMLDEADSFFKSRREMVNIVNAGHTRVSANVTRCNPVTLEPETFNVYSPLLLGSIGALADTIMDRSIIVNIHRKKSTEQVANVLESDNSKYREYGGLFSLWAEDNRERLAEVVPPVVKGLNDRAQDNWNPLLALAELAQGGWPERAQRAAMDLSGHESADLNSLLLKDIATVFNTAGVDAMKSVDLVRELKAMEERPWGDLEYKGLSPAILAHMLAPFGIKPQNIRFEKQAKGYRLERFADTFERYDIQPDMEEAV